MRWNSLHAMVSKFTSCDLLAICFLGMHHNFSTFHHNRCNYHYLSANHSCYLHHKCDHKPYHSTNGHNYRWALINKVNFLIYKLIIGSTTDMPYTTVSSSGDQISPKGTVAWALVAMPVVLQLYCTAMMQTMV